jgi:hypothetical protein
MVGVVMRDLMRHAVGAADAPALGQRRGGGLVGFRPRRTRTGLAVAVVSAVAVVTAGCANSSASSTAQSSASSPFQPGAASPAAAQQGSSSSGAIHFPAALFGLAHNTSAPAQQLARQLTRELALMGMFAHPQAAVYGTSPASRLLVVAITELSASAKKYGGKASATGLRRGFLVMGITDAQRFSAGKGVKQACGHLTRSGTTIILCMTYGKKTVGMAMYFNEAASSLSDAASKTNQAISASGG